MSYAQPHGFYPHMSVSSSVSNGLFEGSATKQNHRQDFEIFPFCPRFQDFNRDFKILIRFQDFNQDFRILIRFQKKFHKISCKFFYNFCIFVEKDFFACVLYGYALANC